MTTFSTHEAAEATGMIEKTVHVWAQEGIVVPSAPRWGRTGTPGVIGSIGHRWAPADIRTLALAALVSQGHNLEVVRVAVEAYQAAGRPETGHLLVGPAGVLWVETAEEAGDACRRARFVMTVIPLAQFVEFPEDADAHVVGVPSRL